MVDESASFSIKSRYVWLTFIALALVGIVFTAVMQISAWDFRNNLWGPAHLITQGQSAYTIRSLGFDSEAVWMPTAVGEFFWLGCLPLTQASNFWWFFNIVLLTVITWVIIPKRKPPPLLLALFLISVALFPPLIVHFNLGQYTLWATLLLLLCPYLLKTERYFRLGVLVALASGKPQLLFIPIVGLAIALYRQSGVKALRAFVAGGVLTTLILTIPLWLSDVQWIPDFIQALRNNQVWEHPSSLQVLQKSLGENGIWLYLLLCLVIIGITAKLWQRLPPQQAVLWSMALNLIAAPYIWTWDYVVLLPLWVYYMFRLNWMGQGLLLLVYSVVWGGMLYIQINLSGNSYLTWWVPWVFIGGVAFAIWVSNKKGLKLVTP